MWKKVKELYFLFGIFAFVSSAIGENENIRFEVLGETVSTTDVIPENSQIIPFPILKMDRIFFDSYDDEEEDEATTVGN